MNSKDLLRSYMDILSEAELAPIDPPTAPTDTLSRRVTPDGNGGTTGGIKISPRNTGPSWNEMSPEEQQAFTVKQQADRAATAQARQNAKDYWANKDPLTRGLAPTDTTATRRVTFNPDGTTSGGFKPNPIDPKAPVRVPPTQAELDQAEELQRKEMGLPSLASKREAQYQQQLANYRKGDMRGAGYGFTPRPGD